MEPINWPAVFAGAALATAIGAAWRRRPVRAGRAASRRAIAAGLGGLAVVMLIAAAMLGHNFARIGSATLAAKPWLYFMQSGGIAAAFVLPAVWLTSARNPPGRHPPMVDCLFLFAAYLAIGAAFWVLA